MRFDHNANIAWLLGEPVTLARLAAFGAASLFSDAKRTIGALPPGASRAALSALRWRASDAGRMLRLAIDEPRHPAAPSALAMFAAFMASWQQKAAEVHPDFAPLMRLPPYPPPDGHDPVGVPVGFQQAWREACARYRSEVLNG